MIRRCDRSEECEEDQSSEFRTVCLPEPLKKRNVKSEVVELSKEVQQFVITPYFRPLSSVVARNIAILFGV